MKYFNCIEIDKLKYSVDMIRFKFTLSKFQQDELYLIIRELKAYDYFKSLKSFQYRELYRIKSSESLSAFSLGVGFNGCSEYSDSKKCFIEFNPNKLYDCPALIRVLRYLVNRVDLELSLYDIAVDIPLSKKFVRMIKDKRVYKFFCYDCEGKNVTEYLGQSAASGRIKLYNKKIESNLDYELTRLELTTNCSDFLIVQKQLPQLLVCGDLDMFSICKLSKSDYVLLQLLWLCDDPSFYFKQLGRDKQAKLKPFIQSNFSLNFSQQVFDKLLSNVFYFADKKNF